MRTSLRGIANKARVDKRHRFRNLYGLLNEEGLMSSWADVNRRAAAGVDRVSARDYAEDLLGNVRRLVERLKRGSYRARLVRRRNIPKEGGKTRPLGIPVVEDKLLQIAAARILEAIYEQDFLPSSFAYRPCRGAKDAVRALTQELQFGCYGYVVEVGIKGFFDHIDHDWMLRMLQERVDDRPFLRLIGRWLKAGVLEEDGQVLHPETGSPQGGSISPILANIYLHYVLDLWFERTVKPRCRARAFLCRYADDAVFAFQHRQEAEALYREIGPRLARFGLEISAAKSRILRFSRFQLGDQALSFEFLGFEFRWMKDRAGTPRVKRRTSRQRLRASLARVTAWCRDRRSLPVREIVAALNAKAARLLPVLWRHRQLRQPAVVLPGSPATAAQVVEPAEPTTQLQLERLQRSPPTPRPRATPDHGMPSPPTDPGGRVLTAEANVPEEPGAGKPHAGIRAGGAG